VSGISGGGAVTVPTSIHPVLKSTVEIPAIGSNFQATSTGASLWAIAGMLVWFPPFGYAEITGVTGDLLTLKNLSITLGTVLSAGSNFIATLPAQPIPAVTIPAVKQFSKTTGRPQIYTQQRINVAWVPNTVTVNLSTYDGYDPTYKAAVLSFWFGGNTNNRIFELWLKLNTVERARVGLASTTTGVFDNGSLIVPIDSASLVIETGETYASGTLYGAATLNVWLDGFLP
jgi:hypothetical protein